jgi:hypothetical protein
MMIDATTFGIQRWRAVQRLLAKSGVRGPFELTGLAGGANNQVYCVVTRSSRLVLKAYSTHPQDRRDRLGAEFPFCTFAWKNGIRCVPQPIAADMKDRLAVYEYVPGRRLRTDEIDAARVREAGRFFARLNRLRERHGACRLPEASEACFSLDAHLALVASRVDRLAQIQVIDAVDRDAVRFVKRDLSPTASAILAGARQQAKRLALAPDQPIAQEDRCISPSDFGFHNVLRRPNGRLVFLDFEYAGWDDPAKMVCDFFCQPRYPVPMECFDAFVSELRGLTTSHTVLLERIRLLLPAYRIKWCCIMLNEFLPAGRHRRQLALNASDEQEAKRRQLQQARHALERAQSFTAPRARCG